ncbi:MAG: type II toxin-antitoxin system RelE family toxin, partial [Prochlorotrichaceae cyanobacterium]
MSYSIIIPKIVQKQLDRLPPVIYERIFEKLKELEKNPRPITSKKLVGKPEEYRLRVGDYRVRYK